MSRRESQFSEAVLPLFAAASAAERAAASTVQPGAEAAVRRRRLTDRFATCGARSLADDELLELVLMGTPGVDDPAALARDLLDRFGVFSAVVSAPLHLLTEHPDVDIALARDLKIIEAAAHRLARARVVRRCLISSWDALLDYCRTTMAHRDVELFRVLFLDRQNALIADEDLGRGTVNHVPVYPREVAKRALELGASAVILVHNHPSGDPTPSEGDIAMTAKVRAALDALEITLHDHLVVGRSGEVSFRGAGLL